ncbi:Vesicle transport protein USE1 [Phytophthora cinnamomi]|uniref:Vesicle transport protein USE1 n=1 Tax=Phytophthora cinnamomi TaxID=4785 RepID=UPI00355AA774|nr:Vesicle transport protein USE1 [Phytophthora cinnamomi]
MTPASLATLDAVNCRRFLAAWTRSQARKQQRLDADIVAQYQQLALHFQRLIQDCDELKALEPELTPVLDAITALKREQEEEEENTQPKRIPRAAEIVKMRERRVRAAKTQTESEPPAVTSVERQSTLSEEVKEQAVDAMPELRTDLTADDFKAMLEVAAPQEEKLSTKAIRKRLGLVDRAGAQASASETVAREEQESIQSEMMSLAKQLKDRTQTINQSLAEDVKILDAVGQSAESNTALLDRENAKLKEQLASSIGLWTSLWLVAMLVIVFIVTYCYMKLFSRRW